MREGRLSDLTFASSERVMSDIKRTYDRMAAVYDALDAVYEWSWKRRLRAELFRHAGPGRLLDVGVGTGCNMPFYPRGADVTGIDTSAGMLERARVRAREFGRADELRQMNLLSLDFPDASFTTVAITFVLLCLPDELQAAALRELRRVTRADGRILLLDYSPSRQAGARLYRRCLGPWMRWAFAGRFDSTPERHLDEAGLAVLERRTFMNDGVTMLILGHGPVMAAIRAA